MVQRNFKPKLLVVTVSTLMAGSAAQASDLTVYQQSRAGTTTIVLMIDTSGSMGSGYITEDYPNVCGGGVKTESSGTTPSYTRRYCLSNSTKYYDRLSRVQDAMFQLMDRNPSPTDPAAPKGVPNTLVMGLGNFSSKGDGVSGRIIVPAKPLDSTQRSAIKSAVAGLTASGGTPSAHAYAEAAAYLLGETTKSYIEQKYKLYIDQTVRRAVSGSYRYYNCTAWSADSYNSGGYGERLCATWSTSYTTSAPSLSYYNNSSNERVYYSSVSNGFTRSVLDENSGFDASDAASKSGDKYISPLPTNSESPECDGQGIYFLTDGEPNNSSSTEASRVMAKSFNQSSFSCSGGLPLVSTPYSTGAWDCIGAYAKALEKKSNPKSISIKTAVVGFGSVFEGLTNKSGSYTTDKGATVSRTFYDCSGASKPDASNACNWGEISTGTGYTGAGGYGQGGFYSGKNPDDVITSIVKFAESLGGNIPPLPTGSTVVPQDKLNGSFLQPYGYLTMMEPKPGESKVLWPGNLKKFKISDGTVKDAKGADVFADRDGKFAEKTFDLWNDTGTADGGITQSGGMYSVIPVPTQAQPNKARRVYVNPNATGTSLTQLTADLTNYTSGSLATNFSLSERLMLLNAIGYELDVTALVLPTTLTPPASPYKVLGGIVHSAPILLTYSAKSSISPTEEDTTREDYVLFGSLEGMLHVVNARTGVESMAFLPRELVKSQGAALKKDSEGSPRPVYGVDAPWVADTEYTINRAGNRFEASSMKVYGGLRMGGTSYYGLDIKNLSSPQMLFRIGADQADFSRMGQTWAKPMITNIRYNKKRTKVMIVPGGYDPCYENPKFGLNTTDTDNVTGCDNKSAAQGNAVYIVDATTGQRLWWTSNTGATVNNTRLMYSITSRVNVLDRDADGLTDHIYFADLGGQVFRIDIDNESQNQANNTSALAKRVVRVLNVNSTNSKHNPRFYEAPTVTIHDEGVERFAMINVASGDRSSPIDVLSKAKGGLAVTRPNENRVFGIFDRDVTRADLYTLADSSLESKDIALSDMQESPQTKGASKATMLGAERIDRKEGWYYDLVGGSITGALKSFNEPVAINGDLYINVFNPTVQSTKSDDCSARVTGESTVRRYCLPFGLANGAQCEIPSEGYYSFKIGAGIQGITIGPDDGNKATRRLIFNQKDVLTDGNVDNKLRVFETPSVLVPQRWMEKQSNPNKVK